MTLKFNGWVYTKALQINGELYCGVTPVIDHDEILHYLISNHVFSREAIEIAFDNDQLIPGYYDMYTQTFTTTHKKASSIYSMIKD